MLRVTIESEAEFDLDEIEERTPGCADAILSAIYDLGAERYPARYPFRGPAQVRKMTVNCGGLRIGIYHHLEVIDDDQSDGTAYVGLEIVAIKDQRYLKAPWRE